MKIRTFLAATAALLAPALASADSFVLVHGAFQDASCWEEVAARLDAAGHDVVAVDLPGRNATGEAAAAVTLGAYIDAVAHAVTSAEQPVILVGHSFGGFSISGAAEAVPERIATLVYVAAYVPQSGESMQALALSDRNSFTAETFVIALDHSHAEILASDQVRVFAQDADVQQAARLTASMIREPLGPIGTPIELTEARFGSVPKAYVRTLLDGTISADLQTRMIERAGIARVRDIETGHAAYLTRPDELARLLLELAE